MEFVEVVVVNIMLADMISTIIDDSQKHFREKAAAARRRKQTFKGVN
jgi:hypothetical protein